MFPSASNWTSCWFACMGSRMSEIKKQSLTDIVHTKLKQRIITGQFTLGQKLNENTLAELFKVSKTPVHEALLKLKAEGLVDILPRSGTFVFSFSSKDLCALANTRIALEQGALKFAYKDNPTHLLAALSENITHSYDILKDNRLSEYLTMDQKFHEILFTMADNHYLSAAYATIFTKISALRHRLDFTHEFIQISLNSHSRIYHAVMNEEISLACDYLDQHINGSFTEESLRQLQSKTKNRP